MRGGSGVREKSELTSSLRSSGRYTANRNWTGKADIARAVISPHLRQRQGGRFAGIATTSDRNRLDTGLT
jgi:hypothetical protein